MHILLQGVVGSTAYGLAGPDSDIDRIGVFAHDTVKLFSLDPQVGSIRPPGEDSVYHEASKAVKLILNGNPTTSEILWLEAYEVKVPLGDELIGIRSAFLSAQRTQDAYLGYASQQFRKLLTRGRFGSDISRQRTPKHARHLMRLVDQGYELYTTGHLRIRLDDPQRYLDFGEQVAADPEVSKTFMAQAHARFDSARTALPGEPRVAVAQAWINRVRAEFYAKES